MSLAVISLISLLVVVILSCVMPKVNSGLLALGIALLLSFIAEGVATKVVLGGFPSSLFVLLVSMCLVFGIAGQNGTLNILTTRAVGMTGGRVLLMPLVFFLLAFVFSAAGPGNIAAVALLAPVAMLLARQYKISYLLNAIMLCTGANAGAFSPFSPTGVVMLGILDTIGLDPNLIWEVFGVSAVLQSLSALAAYGIFLLRVKKRNGTVKTVTQAVKLGQVTLGLRHWMTIGLIFVLMLGVIVFKLDLTVMAVCVAVAMILLSLGDGDKALESLPWGVILMVSGIATLISLMEKVGGLDLATTLIAQFTHESYVSAVLALVSGVVSAYSSSSGVVLPAFVPMVPGLAFKMGITNIVPLVIGVAVGSHMVDVSPLSTLGALSLAAVPEKDQQARIFRMLMIWGMAMAVVAGVLAFMFLDSGLIR